MGDINLNFERVAGPYEGGTGGLAWDGERMLFSAVKQERIYAFDPQAASVSEYRRYTGRTNGLAPGPRGSVYGAQEGGRRVVEFRTDGTTVQTCDQLDGRYHNQPTDLVCDSQGRVWIADAFNTTAPYGPPIYPFLDHASVLRLERGGNSAWTLRRVTTDTRAVRAIALSADERTLYVAEGDADRGAGPRELRAYPVQADGSVGKPRVLLELGSSDRGVEGICADSAGGVIAVGGSAKRGPGAAVYVFSPSGELEATHAAPADMPMRVAFGDAGLASLYLTSGDGHLYRAKESGRTGVKR